MRKKFTWPLVVAAAMSVALVAAPTAQAAHAAPAGNLTDAQSQDLHDRLQALIPADAKARVEALYSRLGIELETDPQDVTDAVINPDDYVCPATTPLREWLQQQSAGLSERDLNDAAVIQTYNPITLDAVLFPEPSAGRFFGQDGEYTNRMQRTFRDLKGFWDISSSDIDLVPMHGSTLLDTDRTTRVLALLFGDSAAAIADLMAQIAGQDKFDHGNWPGFTFNAFAFTLKGEEFPGIGAVSDKILIGDGVLDGARAIHLDDVAPAAILAHEFGHHIQYENGLDVSTTLTGPEASRRLELMADTYGGYYLTHIRGAHVGLGRVRDFVTLFNDLGDCSFASISHHGTPAQRRKAAEFGALNALLPLTKVLPSRTVSARFEKVLPKIVAPDAPPITAADVV